MTCIPSLKINFAALKDDALGQVAEVRAEGRASADARRTGGGRDEGEGQR